MYERATDRARQVLKRAASEAARLNHDYIGTEHILLGLLQEGVGVAVEVLRHTDVDLEQLRQDVESHLTPGPPPVKKTKSILPWTTVKRLPQTPRAKKVVEYAMEEARRLNHNYLGTEHLLLGLLREGDGLGAHVLTDHDLSLESARERVVELLASGRE